MPHPRTRRQPLSTPPRSVAARLGLIACAALSAVIAPAHAEPPAPDLRDAYAAAARVLDANLIGLVRNERVQPVWIGEGDRFWYRRDGDSGHEWLIVDARTGERETAFDTARLHGAAQAAGAADTALVHGLPVQRIEPDGDTTHITLATGAQTLRCEVPSYRCEASSTESRADVLASPDRSRQLFVRSHNLWLRDAHGVERALTRDGVAHFAYGARAGSSYRGVADLRQNGTTPPAGVHWSPDGTHLLGVRHDDRDVEPYPFLESVPSDGSFRPRVWQPRIALMGDAGQSRPELFVTTVETGQTRPVLLPDGWRPFLHPLIHWSGDGRFAYGLAVTGDVRGKALYEIDLRAASARIVIEEHGTTSAAFSTFLYSAPSVRVLDETGEFIWFSQADDWGRLHLHDLRDGRLKRRLSASGRSVREIIAVDAKRRSLHYLSGGSEDDEDPYHTTIHRVSLDRGRPVRLTPESAVFSAALTHHGHADVASRSAVSPSGRWLVDSHSTLNQAPVSVLRDAQTGRVVTTLEQADARAVLDTGWQPPTRVRLMGADGRTPVFATVFFPPSMQPGRRYPVIDAVYGGPQTINAPADYMGAIHTLNPVSRSSLARLGFIVVTIDGRGTPGRSKSFNDFSYGGQFAEPGLSDHVAAIRQLAEHFGNMDLERVGIYGHSFGGYVSARGILRHPEFYKVAVSSAGPHNFQGFYPVDLFFGPPDYGDGARQRPDGKSVPSPYDQLDSGRLARNLRGKLLLVYGDLDENAFPAVTLQLIDALIRANRPYDLMVLPNRDHNFFRVDAYYTQRMWDYFVEHLLGQAPPDDVELNLKQHATPGGY